MIVPDYSADLSDVDDRVDRRTVWLTQAGSFYLYPDISAASLFWETHTQVLTDILYVRQVIDDV